MNQPAHGAPLLQVVPASHHLWIPLLIGPPLLLGGIFATLAPKMTGTGLIMVFFGAGLMWMATRRLRRRTVLIEVTERGIMIYAKPEAIDVSFSLLEDMFIPWERLEAVRFLDRKQISAERLWVALGSGNSVIGPGCVGLKLRRDAFWPPPGTVRGGISMRQAKPGEIYLRTGECSPGGRKLWAEMAALAAKYGGPHIVVDAADVVMAVSARGVRN